MNSSIAGVLKGIKIVDFTQNLPGPYASAVLVSMGAEVIKVEPPKGDPARGMEPFFSMVNRGKRSVVLDLRDDPEALSTARGLIEWADVLLEGFRPGVMDRLGVGYEAARAWNPGLIYVSISAYGQEGPRRDEPAHDLNLQALCGLSHLERDAEGRPRAGVLPVADLSTSLMAVSMVCGALVGRQAEGGVGQRLDVSMGDALFGWVQLWGDGVDTAAQATRAMEGLPGPARGVLERLGRSFVERLDRLKLMALPHYGIFPTQDGHLAVGIVDERHFWQRLCVVLGLGARISKLSPVARTAASPLLKRRIAARLRRESTAHWLYRFKEADVPVNQVLDRRQARRQPQFKARGLVDEQGHLQGFLSGGADSGPPPELGEHNAWVHELLAARSRRRGASV